MARLDLGFQSKAKSSIMPQYPSRKFILSPRKCRFSGPAYGAQCLEVGFYFTGFYGAPWQNNIARSKRRRVCPPARTRLHPVSLLGRTAVQTACGLVQLWLHGLPRHLEKNPRSSVSHATTTNIFATESFRKALGVIHEDHHPIKRKERERDKDARLDTRVTRRAPA